jgi:hypothetical protein
MLLIFMHDYCIKILLIQNKIKIKDHEHELHS